MFISYIFADLILVSSYRDRKKKTRIGEQPKDE